MAGTSNSITTHNVLSGVLNADNVISGLVNTAFNPAYALVTQAGAQIALFINNNDYKMYAQLKDKSGNLIYTSNIIDLPIESMVVNGRYDENTKKLVLVLDNGNEIEVPLGALISGLVNEDDLEANYYDNNEINTILEGYWTKVELTQEDIDNWNAKQEYLNQGDGIEISAETTLKGNTSQESTTGKNLISTNINDLEQGTISGNDGTNASSNNRVRNNRFFNFDYDEIQPNHVWLVPTGYKIAIRVYDQNKNFVGTTAYSGFLGDLPSAYVGLGIKYIKIVYAKTDDSNITPNDIANLEFMISKGNDTTYEPYTGGNPAPNPDYPYPVNVVTGDNEVKVEGKNLFDESNLTLATVQEDGKECYKIAGTTASTSNVIWNEELKENTQYTISMVAKRVQYFNHIVFYYKDGTNNYVNFTNTTFQRINATSQANKTLTKIQIDTGDLPAFNYIEVGTIQLEKGLEVTPYEPYQSQTYPINLGSMELCKIGDYQDVIKRSSGKNLFDESLLTGITMNGITWSTENNKIKISGTSTSTYSQSGNTSINLQKGTYYFVKSGTTSLIYNAWLYNRDGTLIANTKLNNPFTINETATRIVLFVEGLTNGTSYNQEMNFMVSTTSGEQYEPYGKVWYKYGAIRKVKLNISDMNNSDDYPGWRGVPYLNEDYPGLNIAIFPTTRLISNIGDSVNSFGVVTINTNSILILNKAFWNLTQTQWKTNYPNLIFVLYYAISTPTITPITDTTLIEQLDNLSIGLSNKWIKNISQTNAEIPFELEYDNTNLTISASSNLVRNTDYATNQTGGVIKVGNAGTNINNNGYIYAGTLNYTQYNSADNSTFVGKGTLENVITGKELTNKTYVDAADAVFESELFDDGIISAEDSTEANINNTMNKSQLKINLKGNTSQESTTGKNLMPNNATTQTIRGITFTINEDKSITLNGTNDNTGSSTLFLITEADNFSLNAGTYNSIATGVSGVNIGAYDGTNYYTFAGGSGNSITLQNNTSFASVYLQVSKGNSTTFNNKKIYPILSLTPVSESDYEPYTNGPAPNPDYPYPVNVVTGDNEVKVVGKNLFDGVLENGTYTSTGVKEATSLLYRNKNIISVKPETTYTFSINGTKQKYVVYFYDNTQTFISWSSAFSTGVISTPSNAYYMNFRCFADDYDANFLNLKVQLEEGSTATPYEEHKEQTYPINLGSMELCKIGDYQDYLYKENGVWYKYGAIGKVVLDGSESGWWTQNNQFRLTLSNAKQGLNCLCNYFKSGASDKQCYIYVDNYVSFKYEDLNNDLTSWKTWLSTHNTTLYYALLTPTATEITDTTLIEQLDNLEKAYSYDTQTNISQTNQDKPFILDINAIADNVNGLKLENENQEYKTNKVIELSSNSTDDEYPSAKCVYDIVGNIEAVLAAMDSGSGV